jgi:hypothetical protein
MTITINLERDVAEKLRTQAAARGVPVTEYVEDLVRTVAQRAPEVGAAGESRPSLAEFEADWAAFAEGLDHVPPLAPEAFSREAMYADHD